jgi:hypothetical protein
LDIRGQRSRARASLQESSTSHLLPSPLPLCLCG